MSYATVSLCIVFILVEEIQPLNVKTDLYSDTFVAEINGNGGTAARIARKYGFNLHEEVIPGVFILKKPGTRKLSKLPSFSRLSKIVGKEKEVKAFRQEKWLSRYPRAFSVLDTNWADMWYLRDKQTPRMGVLQAWDLGYSGKNVVIAIVDDGLDKTHPDLLNYNASLSRDVNTDLPDPSPSGTSSHGTECAGVAAATKNEICILGVAFGAQLAGIKLIDTFGTLLSTEAKALTFKLQDIHIYSNSWGGKDDGTTFETLDTVVDRALELGVTTGRGGRGAVYVWAAGNGGDDDNCNCDGYVNSIYTIGITSVSASRYPPTYSERCSATLATTYSGGTDRKLFTTMQGGGCEGTFSGTSASTPMAAGMIALAIEANKDLTWRDIQHLIVQTAKSDKLDGGEWTQNQAGRNVSKYFGFGLMNAEDMIIKANNWTYVPAQNKCVGRIIPVLENIQHSKRIITSTVEFDPCKGTDDYVDHLEHVQVTVNLTASKRGEVELAIISPSGTESQLLSPRPRDMNTQLTWTFMTVHFWGERSTPGKWTLKMEIASRGESGFLESWNLVLFGTEKDPKLGNPGNRPILGQTNLKTTTTTPTSDSQMTQKNISGERVYPTTGINKGAGSLNKHPNDNDNSTSKLVYILGGAAGGSAVVCASIYAVVRYKKGMKGSQDTKPAFSSNGRIYPDQSYSS